MYKIGQLARFSRVSVKALRHYDALGLLQPAWVDPLTGYRYYALEQMDRLHRIRALKDVGFSLDQIGRLLDERPTNAQVRAMLLARKVDLEERLQAETDLLRRVEARLRLMDKEEKMPGYEVLLKPVEPQLAACVKDTVPDMDTVSPTFNRIFDEACEHINRHGGKFAGPGFDFWYDEPFDKDIRVEACVPIAASIPETDRVRVRVVEGCPAAAATIHRGDFGGLSQAIQALVGWIEANGYRIAGPYRETYLHHERENPDASITEVLFPVEKDG